MTSEISVVIPAYEMADLTARALASVAAQEGVTIEVIVTDDSAGDGIAEVVDRAVADGFAPRWIRGPRSGVAADNWNHGLAQARAPLKVVLHQDEHYIDPRFLSRAARALAHGGVAAAVGGTQVTGVARRSRFARVAPLRRLPGARRLLPLINWMGPTAAFVFRGDHRFDPAYVQLADVEFYLRVLRTGRLAIIPGLSVGSLGHHSDSISARVDTHGLALAELDLMAHRRPAMISPLERAAFHAALTWRVARRARRPA